MNNTSLALEALLTRYLNLFSDTEHKLPLVTFEKPWASPCIAQETDTPGSYYWKPVKREQPISFAELEHALEMTFHPDISAFYGTFWSNGICVERHDLNFNLIQIWNDEDENFLKENILGHAFAKIKGKLPLSFFIGCTNNNQIICLEQESGHIVLEKPGYAAHKVLAESLDQFLIDLTPTTDNYTG